jgi:hypothetical protein
MDAITGSTKEKIIEILIDVACEYCEMHPVDGMAYLEKKTDEILSLLNLNPGVGA